MDMKDFEKSKDRIKNFLPSKNEDGKHVLNDEQMDAILEIAYNIGQMDSSHNLRQGLYHMQQY